MSAPTMAQRWQVHAHLDENTCTPCKNNNGRTYRNRADAYADYPGGSGYIKCEGSSNCRCTVSKRGKASNAMDAAKLNAMVAQARAGQHAVSGRALAATACAKLGDVFTPPAPGAPLNFSMAAPVGDGNAKLYIYDAIGGWDGIQAIDVVRALAGVTGPLDVHINSGGGVIFEGTAIYNAIAGYQGTKTAYIDGIAASCASFIMLACDEIEAAENAVVMVHDGAGLAYGTADSIRDTADVLDMLSDTIAATYAKRAGGTAAGWRDIMRDGDTWYNAAAALEVKLVTRVAGASASDDAPPDETQGDASAEALDVLAAFTAAFAAVADGADDVSRETLNPQPVVEGSPSLAAIDVVSMRDALKGLLV